MTEDNAVGAPAIDFERAQLSDDAANMSCVACKQAIESSYYSINGRFVCPTCHGQLVASKNTGGSLLAALLLGLVAAAVGGALYYGVAVVFKVEIGLIAIVVGVLVGKAVRKGAGLRSSRAYQVLAVLLTYLAIAGAVLAFSGVESVAHAFTLALIMPVLMIRDVSGALGLLIMGIGLYEGWKHSAAPVLEVQGPFAHQAVAP